MSPRASLSLQFSRRNFIYQIEQCCTFAKCDTALFSLRINEQEAKNMDISETFDKNRKNIWRALDDYRAHTKATYVLDDVTARFVNRLARDNAYSKSELRELFRKSPAWDEALDALVINGTRTHNPDFSRVQQLAEEILYPAQQSMDFEEIGYMNDAIKFFIKPRKEADMAIEAMKKIAPNAYVPGKKHSRIFRAICDALGVSDDTAGSNFQRLYAQFADEIASKKINFKLYVSLNPAHFLTMSNPKEDRRGDTLTSCHTFNNTEHPYNNGCSGYARDNYTFITFVAADPGVPETLNNRKTARQIFAYKPGNGLLLQSRLYNTAGGTYGAQEDSKLYRDLVQRELSELEQAPNLWKTYAYVGNNICTLNRGLGFGGYPDWQYEDFDAKLSIRCDHKDDFKAFSIGTYGLCIKCGCEISTNLYCSACDEEEDDDERCEVCEEYFANTYPVMDEHGREIYVCADCRDRYYVYCGECECYFPKDKVIEVADGSHVCADCLAQLYEKCEGCGRYFPKEELLEGHCAECRNAGAVAGKESAA